MGTTWHLTIEGASTKGTIIHTHYTHFRDELKEEDVIMSEIAPTRKERAVGMHIINFLVRDLEKSFEFYVDRLGFERTGSREVRITKSTKIWLHQVEDTVNIPNDVSMHWFEIGTKDIEQFYQKLKEDYNSYLLRYNHYALLKECIYLHP